MIKSDLNNFNDITDHYLQAYNRLVIIFNLVEDNRKAEAREYLSQFDAFSRVSVGVITAEIKVKGFDVVKKKVSEKLAKIGNLVDSLEGDLEESV